MERPVSGGHLLLAPGVGTSPALAAVVARLARRHAVHADDPALGAPAAVLARPSTRWRREWNGARVAWWLDDLRAAPPVDRRVSLLVTQRGTGDGDGDRGRGGDGGDGGSSALPVEVVPSPGIDGTEWQPIVPFVRARLRRRVGLPEHLVVEVGTPGAPPLDDTVAADALRLAAAAVVGPGHVLRALALATPTVCDLLAADLVGAVPGRDVVVASPSEARAAAEELAHDLRRATLLARAGRRLVERHHDVAASARRIAAALALPATGPAPIARVADELEALGTPIDATVTGRVAAAVISLGGSASQAVTRSLRW